MPDANLDQLFHKINNIQKLTPKDSSNLEGPLTLNELGSALKSMKNGKCPGIDGFPAEFFKVFWNKLKYFVYRSLNYAYETGCMSISLRQCIISCLPKGDKPRQFLKNWRPISLLSVVYKIGSAAIANRIKIHLDKLISKSQTGFVSGRFIGENTRLLYDILKYTEDFDISGLLVLVDFEKAFDSISWKFLYSVLNYFNFGPSILKWVSTFNYEIKASVIQCGKMSKFFNVERGCRQGDPLAAYMFILCAQILLMMVAHNDDIIGIVIDGKEIKLTQFADDTTLILNGCRDSLLAALNTIEIFGSISGLKVNTDKTKLVWIGKKRHSKDKLEINKNLSWGNTMFRFLGIEFSVDLCNMMDQNFKPLIIKTENILKSWRKHYLTPLGKITILKTLIIPMFNHLFLSLPNPSYNYLAQLNRIMYHFIWDGKPEKISRIQMCKPYDQGGLKMIDLECFIKALKVTWVRRLYMSQDSPWINLANLNIGEINKLLLLGPQWSYKQVDKIKNLFWKDVVLAWASVLEIIIETDRLNAPLWYNPKISKDHFFEPKLFKNGVIAPVDILTIEGKLLSSENIKHFFKTSPNFLSYHRLKVGINKYIDKTTIDNMLQAKPFIPSQIRVISKSKKGSQDFHKILHSINENKSIELLKKWEHQCGVPINNKMWKDILNVCFHTIKDNSLIWFQYRIINRILGTRAYMHKIGIATSGTCSFCGSCDETLAHLFINCEKTKEFWKNIKTWLSRSVNFEIFLDPLAIMFGISSSRHSQQATNVIYITGKYFIFICARKNESLNIFNYQTFLKSKYVEQYYLSRVQMRQIAFCQTWKIFSQLFN